MISTAALSIPEPDEAFTDEELDALALGGDPDTEVPAHAVPVWDVIEPGPRQLLPEWYMAAWTLGGRRVSRWQRWVVVAVIVSFLVIDAFGLCITYGQLVPA